MKVDKIVLGEIYTNCYILSENEKAVVVDVPYKSTEIISEFLENERLTPTAVLLTHGHVDHCGGADEFAKKYGIPVFVHKNDVILCNTAKMHLLNFSTDNCNPTDTFDGDEGAISVGGFEFYMINTPGHTPGSCLFLFGDNMLSGDTLFRGSIGRSDLAMGDAHAMQQSMKKIKMLEGKYTVYPGHGDSTTLDDEKRRNFYLR